MLRGTSTGRVRRPPPPPPSYIYYEGLGRQWERVGSFSRDSVHVVQSLTVATYNTLSDEQVRLNSELYRHLPGHMLSWPYRSELLIQEVAFFNADILCLQEVDERHYYNFFRRQLDEFGYTGWYKRRTGDKPDGCAIFWKYDTFQRALVRAVNFKVHGVPVLDRDNIGLIIILKLRQSGRADHFPVAICIATTHLLYNEKRGDVKLAQLVLLFAEIDQVCGQFKRENPHHHLFLLLCGDLNLYPFCPLYSFITTGEIWYEGMDRSTLSGQKQPVRGPVDLQYRLNFPLFPDWLNINDSCCYHRHHSTPQQREAVHSSGTPTTHGYASSSAHLRHKFRFSSAYQHWTPTRQMEMTTCLLNGSKNTVDYIFYTSHPLFTEPRGTLSRTLPRMNLTDRRTLIASDSLTMMGFLPNSLMPSDHQALQARFELCIPRRH